MCGEEGGLKVLEECCGVGLGWLLEHWCWSITGRGGGVE